MTPAQDSLFTAASGGQSAAAVLVGIASIVMILAILWVAWAGVALFDHWRSGALEYGEFAWYLVRAAMILAILGWHIR